MPGDPVVVSAVCRGGLFSIGEQFESGFTGGRAMDPHRSCPFSVEVDSRLFGQLVGRGVVPCDEYSLEWQSPVRLTAEAVDSETDAEGFRDGNTCLLFRGKSAGSPFSDECSRQPVARGIEREQIRLEPESEAEYSVLRL